MLEGKLDLLAQFELRSQSEELRTVKPEGVSALRIAYLEYQRRFEAVGVTDLDHDDLTDIFRGSWLPLFSRCVRLSHFIR